jgi:exosortase/archaeosortase family protein
MHNKRSFVAKDTIRLILVLTVVILVVLPFATTFNEFLTRIVEGTGAYRLIQSVFVPYLSRIAVGILSRLPGLSVSPYQFGVIVNGVDVRITWNCLGWQGYLLFFVSLIFGLRGNFKLSSKLEAVILGFFGTFLVNIFRLVFTAALVGWSPGLFVILFHNYFMTFVAILWLLLFWWFSYKYVLEEKNV